MRRGVISPLAISGLRTRYFPKSRIGHGLVSMAPWIDVVLVLVFLLMLENRLVVEPGVLIELPEAEFREGMGSDLIAVVLSGEERSRRQREEIVLFEDERYVMSDAKQMERLQEALRSRLRGNPDAGLVLEADRRVRQGALVRLFEMARRAGIRTVNLATRDPRDYLPGAR